MSVIAIFYASVLPIFLILGVGVLVDRLGKVDLPTLSRLNFYVFVPALVFVSLLQTEEQAGNVVGLIVFSLLHLVLLYGLSRLLFSRRPFHDQRTVLTLSTLFYNCGNYGIPLIALAFGPRYTAVVAVVLMVQNLASFTFGIWILEKDSRSIGKVLLGFLRIPVVYAVAVPFLLRGLGVSLTEPLERACEYLADGLIPVALLTLGAQLSRNWGFGSIGSIGVLAFIRLAVSPALAALLVVLPVFHFEPTVNAVLIVLAGLPVAVNVYILSAQYRKGEELASQGVFWTTLLSAVSVSVLLALLR